MDEKQLKELVGRVHRNLRVTKVVATRAVKSRNGEFFAGYAAAWHSTQTDGGGPGADADIMDLEGDSAASGMTPQEAKVAYYLLAMEVDISANEQAYANGEMSGDALRDTIRAIKNRYARLMREKFMPGSSEGGSDSG